MSHFQTSCLPSNFAFFRGELWTQTTTVGNLSLKYKREVGPDVDSDSLPIRHGAHTMFTFGSAASKDDGINGDTLWSLPSWVHDGTLASRGTKARVGMCTGLLVTWQRKYKYCHFQGHIHRQHTHACTLAQFIFASSAPHNLM